MKYIKCKNCLFLNKCPSGQKCVSLNKEFARNCPIGETKEGAEDGK